MRDSRRLEPGTRTLRGRFAATSAGSKTGARSGRAGRSGRVRPQDSGLRVRVAASGAGQAADHRGAHVAAPVRSRPAPARRVARLVEREDGYDQVEVILDPVPDALREKPPEGALRR